MKTDCKIKKINNLNPGDNNDKYGGGGGKVGQPNLVLMAKVFLRPFSDLPWPILA